ncbi:MAG: ABC transporter substrate-binding protein [Dehalococcoidales bacterium]|nr:ABC transporter substrate-binding protein [Dehalococcoidales bacterium]
MRKFLVIFLAVVTATIIVLTGCGKPAATPTATPSAPATTKTTAATTPAAPAKTSATPSATATAPQPVKGGTLRCIAGAIPKNLGWGPEKAPSDNYLMLPVLERLCEWDEQGNQIPVLAESWDVDIKNLTLTWHLRKGVKFHDGTDWDAEALRWNYQIALEYQRLSDGQYIKSMEVVDKHTLVMHLSAFNFVMITNFGWMTPISPTAFEKAGGGNREKSIDWARQNAVGTGAFTVAEYRRDDVIKFVKNPNYWRAGMPYLDAIELRYIPDSMVASAMMEAGEADMWFDVSAVENLLTLKEKGFKINWGPGMFFHILPDSSDPNSPFANKKVREAVEYAIDRPTIAQMLGQGLYEPLHQMSYSVSPSYIPDYNPRPYNPEKAKQLLAEAGYPNGFKTTILATDAARDAIAALKSYLDAVGIIVEPDIADLGRYFGAVFGTGWKGLVLSASGINPDATDLFIHFGPNPLTYRTGTIAKSPEFLELCKQALDPKYTDAFSAMPKIKEAIRQATEDAMIIPLWRTCNSAIMQPYVHSDYFKIHGVIWTPYDDWMEKR